MNLPKQVQEYLNYPALQLINPNTGLPENEVDFNPLKQAVIISFFACLFKATRTRDNATIVSKIVDEKELVNSIVIKETDVVELIANYTNQTTHIVNEKMLEVANGYLEFMAQSSTEADKLNENFLQEILTSQRQEILKYLPPTLKLGVLLHDETLDDVTNKMEGPVSTLMNKIENIFSSTD